MKCLYCPSVSNLQREHLVPRSRGGLNIEENVFHACKSCNIKKGNRLPSEWRGDLPSEVYELERLALKLHPNVRAKNTKLLKGGVINVRCTEPQRELLESIASSEGLGLSTWLLHVGIRVAQERKATAGGTR